MNSDPVALAKQIKLYRRQVRQNPEAFLPDLAMSLNNLGAMLSDLGRREEALEATEEAVGLYRGLAEANPEAFLPDLAGSLNNLGSDLSALGRREEALEATEEAVGLYRGLAEANPEAFLPDLAMSLNNLGSDLSALGRREEALEAYEEAVRTLAPFFRRLRDLLVNGEKVLIPFLVRIIETTAAMHNPTRDGRHISVRLSLYPHLFKKKIPTNNPKASVATVVADAPI